MVNFHLALRTAVERKIKNFRKKQKAEIPKKHKILKNSEIPKKHKIPKKAENNEILKIMNFQKIMKFSK